MIKRSVLMTSFLLGGLASVLTPAWAAETVRDVRVEGNARLETGTVLSYLTLSKGEEATDEAIDASLKALYATDLFHDVRIGMDHGSLLVQVEENPIVNKVVFEGNDAISKEDLEKEVQIKSRQVYTVPRLQKDTMRLQELYRRSGRFAAKVEPKLVKLEQNRVDVIFEISEGDRTGIGNITFVGNKQFDQDELAAAITTRESAWWRVFSSSDYYDPDRMNADKEFLRKFYLSEGYVDFRVISAVAELAPDKSDFYLTFALDEGERYKFGSLNISSAIKGVDAKILRDNLLMNEGEWYNADKVEKTVTKLMAVLGDAQFAFANVLPEITKNADKRTVDITFNIKEGERVYIGKIDISGNSRTVDKVIRREIPLSEGDPFSTSKINKAERALKDLGYFEEAKVVPVDGDQPDRANLMVAVKEKATGEIAVGAGYSSTDGALGNFSLSERNFMGKGQNLRFGGSVSGRTKQVDISFTEPRLFDRNLSAGVDVFRVQTDNQDLSSYDTRSTGFALRSGFPYSENLRQGLTYTFRNDNISSVPSDASLYVQEQAGTAVTSSFGQSLTYDTLDSRLDPTLGYILNLNTDIAGLGGNRKYFRVRMGGTQYYPLAEQWVLSARGEVGQIWGLEGATRINERFFLGSDTFRGFQYAGMGPRDTNSVNEDALGGTRFTRASIELDTPTPLPDDLGLKGHIFTDMGTLGHVDQSAIAGGTFKDSESLHISAGVGLSWQSPFGPIRIDFAKPIMKQSFDKLEQIHFSFGTRF